MAGCGKVCNEEEEVKQVHLLPLQGERCRGFDSAGELPPNSPLIHRMGFPSLCTSELSNKAPKQKVENVREGQSASSSSVSDVFPPSLVPRVDG